MKSDEEIKEFIDNKEALTATELTKFIYPDWNKNSIKKGMSQKYRVAKWWEYVLNTKNWEKLREYKEQKITNGNKNIERFNRFREIYLTDPRFREIGRRRASKLIKRIYGFDIPVSTMERYLKAIKETDQCTAGNS